MSEVKKTVTETKETAAKTKETVTELAADSLKTKETVKKRGRPKGSKDKKPRKSSVRESPVLDGGYHNLDLKEGDNAKLMRVNMELFNLPTFDIYKATPDEINERLNTFFNIYFAADLKPTVAGMAMSLGINRVTLNKIVNDQPINDHGTMSTLPPSSVYNLKKAYSMMENFWESYMNGGKINPVTGIFLAKNNFGYVDKQETVLTPNTKQDNDYSMDEIKERYRLSEPAATELLEDKES